MDPKNETALAHFELRLQIDTGVIDRELIEQPQLYFKVAEEAARAESRAVSEKDQLAQVEAGLYRAISLEKEGLGQRVTETVLKNEILVHKDRVAQLKKYHAALHQAAVWEAMRDSYSSRGYMLRDLCQLSLSGFMSKSSVTGNEGRAKEVKAEVAKEELRKKRNTDWKKDLE